MSLACYAKSDLKSDPCPSSSLCPNNSPKFCLINSLPFLLPLKNTHHISYPDIISKKINRTPKGHKNRPMLHGPLQMSPPITWMSSALQL